MARVLITGSADGLGLMAAVLLVGQGHAVTLHARNESRAGDARTALPSAESVVVGDLATIAGMRQVAAGADATGRYDAVIHNAGIGYREPRRVETDDGLERVFAVNVLAPYLLTALLTAPGRLVYLSSGMHRGGHASLSDPRRSRGQGDRRLLLPPAAPGGTPRGARHRLPRRAPRLLRDADRCRPACACGAATVTVGPRPRR
jgi:NAD(P)-dependent dehydrogenase (short-subunit alcohol dehydrogenase family)